MKKVIFFSSFLITVFIFALFPRQVNAQSSTIKTVTEQQTFKKYTCPMHPEIVMDKPGNCPKCGMTLIEKTDTKQGGIHKMHDMKNMKEMQDTTKMKCDSTKMKKCCMNGKMSSE